MESFSLKKHKNSTPILGILTIFIDFLLFLRKQSSYGIGVICEKFFFYFVTFFSIFSPNISNDNVTDRLVTSDSIQTINWDWSLVRVKKRN